MTYHNPYAGITQSKSSRIPSIDLLRGIVMIIMALDHVRDYFHNDAFLYSPSDLTQTSVPLFLTRFLTHYCAPVFVFLAGISAYLYGANKTRKELAFYLYTRGIWLVFVELFLINFGRSFNLSFPFFNLQVIWAIGICMIVLAGMIYLNRYLILVIAVLLIGAHNLLDQVHAPGNFLWALLHEDRDFVIGPFNVFVHYPVIPWIGIIALGYFLGALYDPGYDPGKRKKTLLSVGFGMLALFVTLQAFNKYGDPVHWSIQKNAVFSLLSFINVTKYPPSLLYILVTLGPAMIFLAFAEKPVKKISEIIEVFGRTPFFYYVIHVYAIHLLAMIGALISGYPLSSMILSDRVNRVPELKGYGFDLVIVYLVWLGLILLLYPCCKWFGRYKKNHQSRQWWLSYL